MNDEFARGGSAPMTEDRVRTLIDAYGAAPERWPAAERAAGAALMARTPALQAHARDAGALDAMLDAAAVPEVPPSLAAAVHGMNPETAAMPAERRQFSLPRFVGPMLPQFRPAALALATVLGLAFGYAGMFGERSGGWETLDASLIAGGSQMVGVTYIMEETR